jgi:amino acid permease
MHLTDTAILLRWCACSSILPIPFAISKTGVLVGCLTMLLVAWANDATSCMLIRAAGATGKITYEALAEWAGGKAWKVRSQAAWW